MSGGGKVEAIHVAAKKGQPTEPRERVSVVAGQGIEGDRKFGANHDITLIEAEALEGLLADTGIALPAEEAGRNVVTRGIDLNALVGQRFRIGEVECFGQRGSDDAPESDQ